MVHEKNRDALVYRGTKSVPESRKRCYAWGKPAPGDGLGEVFEFAA